MELARRGLNCFHGGYGRGESRERPRDAGLLNGSAELLQTLVAPSYTEGWFLMAALMIVALAVNGASESPVT